MPYNLREYVVTATYKTKVLAKSDLEAIEKSKMSNPTIEQIIYTVKLVRIRWWSIKRKNNP